MTKVQAKKLKVGDAVVWDGDEDDKGVVRAVAPAVAVEIEWTTYPHREWSRVADMDRVSLAAGGQSSKVGNLVGVLGLVVMGVALSGCIGAPFVADGDVREADTEVADAPVVPDGDGADAGGPAVDSGIPPVRVDAGVGTVDAGAWSIPADAADSGACDGGPLYLHSTGLGGVTWRDCAPTGTYDAAEALAACAAYAAATGAQAVSNGVPLCALVDDPVTESCASSALLNTGPAVVWTYSGGGQYAATGHVAVLGTHDDGTCTSVQDPGWD